MNTEVDPNGESAHTPKKGFIKLNRVPSYGISNHYKRECISDVPSAEQK